MLTDQPCELTNVPRIRDVDVLLDLIEGLGGARRGARYSHAADSMRARSRSDRPDPVLVGRLRGSVLLLGPLLARRGSARLAPPGGDFPARRTISTHLERAPAMGAVQLDEPGHALEAPERRLTGASILSRRSLRHRHRDGAAGRGGGARRLGDPPRRDGAARRRALRVSARDGRRHRGGRHVDDPGRCRRRALAAPKHRLFGDYIEAGSWGVVAAITGGEIEVHGRAHRGPRGHRRAAAEAWGSIAPTTMTCSWCRALDADAPSAASRPACGLVFPATW